MGMALPVDKLKGYTGTIHDFIKKCFSALLLFLVLRGEKTHFFRGISATPAGSRPRKILPSLCFACHGVPETQEAIMDTDEMKVRAQQAMDKTKKTVGELKDEAADGAETAFDKTKEFAREAGETLMDGYRGLKESVSERLGYYSGNAEKDARTYMDNYRDDLKTYREEWEKARSAYRKARLKEQKAYLEHHAELPVQENVESDLSMPGEGASR